MNNSSIAEHDHRKRRCPMLGNEVPFGYCRAPAAPLPCRKLLDCWWETFPVDEWAKANLTSQANEHFHTPPAPKAATLLNLIQEAKNRIAANDQSPNVPPA